MIQRDKEDATIHLTISPACSKRLGAVHPRGVPHRRLLRVECFPTHVVAQGGPARAAWQARDCDWVGGQRQIVASVGPLGRNARGFRGSTCARYLGVHQPGKRSLWVATPVARNRRCRSTYSQSNLCARFCYVCRWRRLPRAYGENSSKAHSTNAAQGASSARPESRVGRTISPPFWREELLMSWLFRSHG